MPYRVYHISNIHIRILKFSIEPVYIDEHNVPASPIYTEIDNITGSKSKKSLRSQSANTSEPREEAPTDYPLYHTLEKSDHVKAVDDKEIYEEVEAVKDVEAVERVEAVKEMEALPVEEAEEVKAIEETPQGFEKELDV